MTKVYTKTGDKGQTGLIGGNRVWKDDLKVHCYGTIDEANATIGVAYSLCEHEEVKELLHKIQKKLFVLGAELACDEKGTHYIKEKIQKKDIEKLEQIINHYTEKLEPQKKFIIPGKTTTSSILHVARTIIRRAERWSIKLYKQEQLRDEVIQYINRLSDTLFILARIEERYEWVENIKDQVIKRIKDNDVPRMSLSIAKKMAQAAEGKARDMGVSIAFCVVDEGGHLVLFHRMEDVLLVSIDLSIHKAYTANALKVPTHELAKMCEPKQMLHSIQTMDKITLVGGGYPLKIGQKYVGGLGVSGGTVEEDQIIASCALRVFEMEK